MSKRATSGNTGRQKKIPPKKYIPEYAVSFYREYYHIPHFLTIPARVYNHTAMKKPWRTFLDIFIILFFAIGVRYLYAQTTPKIALSYDSLGYYEYGLRLIQHPSLDNFISQFRTPIYPLFIGLTMVFSGSPHAEVGTLEYYSGMELLMVFQHCIAIFTIITLYFCLKKLQVRHWLILVTTILYSLNILLFFWERTLLTESLSISWTVCMTLTSIIILQKAKFRYFVIFLILSIIGVLLRPANIFLPLGFMISIMLSYRKINIVIPTSIILIIYILVPFGWSLYNSNVHQYRGFQTYSDINIFGRIMVKHIPGLAGSKFPSIYTGFEEYLATSKNIDPYAYFEHLDQNFFSFPQNLIDLHGFNVEILKTEFFAYIFSIIPDIPKAFYESLSIPHNYTEISHFLFSLLHFSYLLCFPFWVYRIGKLKQAQTFLQKLPILLYALAWIQLIINVGLSYSEYFRLNISVMPLFYLSLILWLNQYLTSKNHSQPSKH